MTPLNPGTLRSQNFASGARVQRLRYGIDLAPTDRHRRFDRKRQVVLAGLFDAQATRGRGRKTQGAPRQAYLLDNSAEALIKSILYRYKISACNRYFRSLMADRSQQHQPVISIRISEELRERLDKLKQMMALKSGESVSTSEAAKQLLESAKDDRFEVVGLLLEPTESLLRVRKKLEGRLTLSQAEWALIAYYCTQGAESFASTEQGQLSYDSLADMLEAFLAAHAVARRSSRVSLEWVYLQTLPEDKQVALKEPEEVTKDDVRRVVKRTIQMLRSLAQNRRRPILAVRNLYTMLDDEKFSNAEKLNDALWPHWKALWRGCARGPFAVEQKPP